MELIRKVNPTDRDIPKRERERRYQLKSELQSTLVVRFADELRVELDDHREGVVLLKHRTQPIHGGHAVIAELQPDARAWVRLQLDLGAGSVPDPVSPEPPSDRRSRVRGPRAAERHTVADALRLGREALEEFDFERARELFDEAYDATQGGALAAEALLELLVDHLGADHEALELGGSLSQEATRASGARTLLAQAAQRAGKPHAALEWLRGVDNERAVEILGEIGAKAAGRGDRALAETALAQLLPRDGASAAIAHLQQVLRDYDARQRAPQEALIQERIQAGAWDEAETMARELLSNHPDSPVARKCLRSADERRRVQHAAAALQQAERLSEQGQFDDVVRLAREVLSLNTGDDSVVRIARGLLDDAEAKIAIAREAEDVANLTAMVSGKLTERAACAFLESNATIRERVKAHAHVPALTWLERAMTARGATVTEAVAAVLAFLGVHDRASAEPQAFLDAVAAHERILNLVESAREAMADARRALQEKRRISAVQSLQLAERNEQDGKHAGAQEALDAVDCARLAPAERVRYDTLRTRLAAVREREAMEARFRSLTERGDLFGARDFAEACHLRCDAIGGAVWADRAGTLQQRIHELWHWRRFDDREAKGSFAPFPLALLREAVVRSVKSDGTLVLAASGGCWAFVAELDTAGTLAYRVGFEAPEPLGELEVVVEEPDIWLIGEGYALMVDGRDWSIRRWWPLKNRAQSKELVEDVRLLQGGKALVMETSIQVQRVSDLHVIDARTGAHRRTLDGWWNAKVITGAREPFAVAHRPGDSLGAFDARGASLFSTPIAVRGHAYCAAVLPDMQGFVVACPGAASDDGAEQVRLLVLDPRGALLGDVTLGNTEIESGVQVATSLRNQMLFVRAFTAGAAAEELFAFRCTEGSSLVEQYRIPIPVGTTLVQDCEAQRVFAAISTPEGIELAELGSTPLEFRGRAATQPRPLPLLPWIDAMCAAHDGEINAAGLAMFASLKDLDPAGQMSRIEAIKRKEANDAEGLLALHRALEHLRRRKDAAGLLDWIAELHPNNARVRTALAARSVRDSPGWQRVRELLEPIEPTELPEAMLRHHWHLLGIARVVSRDFDAAAEAFGRGLEHDGGCSLQPWLDLVTSAEAPDGEDPSAVRRVIAILRRADSCVASGDLQAALRSLDTAVVWLAREVQSSARLADVVLRRVDAGEPLGARGALALAFFCGLHAEEEQFRGELPLPGPLGWPLEVLNELAARAASALRARSDA